MKTTWDRFADSRASGLFLVAAAVLAWEVLARMDLRVAFYIPPLSLILTALTQLTLSGEIPRAALSTLGTLAWGYGWGTLAGAAVGILIGRSRTLYDISEPTLELLRPAPAVAVLPLAILLLGSDFAVRSAVIAWAAFWPVLSAVCDGVRAIDPVLLDTARSYGYRGRAVVWRIVLPATLPYAMAGLRVALTLAFVIAIFVEMFAGDRGLGYVISHYREAIRVPQTYAAMLAVAVVGYVLNAAFLAWESRTVRWHRASLETM